MGSKQGEKEDQGTSKTRSEQKGQIQCQWYIRQQETLHGTPICKRAK